MISIDVVFNNCADEKFSSTSLNLLNRIMSIKSPVDFDSEFASNDELDRLVQEMDRANRRSSQGNLLRRAVTSAKSCRASDVVFI